MDRSTSLYLINNIFNNNSVMPQVRILDQTGSLDGDKVKA